MSGLLALLDDVVALAKVAAASLDDVAAQATKAGSKAAGAVIDDAAVTPKYVHGFSASRELPIVVKIAKGSLFNKLVVLLPLALLLASYAPWAITPLLMLGGSYLCFEGAEKLHHALHHPPPERAQLTTTDDGGVGLEEARVRGAIKTDFILSAEIMTIALAALPPGQGLAMKAATLAVVALGITVAVYGAVALLVKADDAGLLLHQRGGALAGLGRAIVTLMPRLMKLLGLVGTAAMLWVGGQIVLHGAHALGQHQPHAAIEALAAAVGASLPAVAGASAWLTGALGAGLFGVLWGALILLLLTRGLGPLWARLRAR